MASLDKHQLKELTIEGPSTAQTPNEVSSRIKAIMLLLALAISPVAQAESPECDTEGSYSSCDTEDCVQILVDDHAGKTFYSFLRAYLTESGQLPKDDAQALGILNYIITVSRELNPTLNLDNFNSINGKAVLLPRVINFESTCETAVTFGRELTTITIPEGQGFLWIQQNYGATEAQVRQLNPQLKGRGLQKGETLEVPNKAKK